MKIEFYKGGFLNLSWKWRLWDDDEIIAYGSGFNSKQKAQKSLDSIKEILEDNSFSGLEIYNSGSIRPGWKWRLKSKNGKILASDDGFIDENECNIYAKSFKYYFLKQYKNES